MADGRDFEGVERAKDRSTFARVCILALVGFGVGIAWPKLTGVKLGPSAPGSSSSESTAQAATRAPETVALSAATTLASSAAATPQPSAPSTLTLGRTVMLSCTTKSGETKKGADCGRLADLDALVEPKLRKLALCENGNRAVGHVSLVANVDFEAGKLETSLGKSTTASSADAVATCLRSELAGVDLGKVAHELPRYTVVFKLDLAASETAPAVAAAPSKAAAPSVESETDTDSKPVAKPSSGEAEAPAATGGSLTSVEWEVGIVRDAPRTGNVVARLPRGSKVRLGSSDGGWYKIRYGEGYGSEGWLFRGALGR